MNDGERQEEFAVLIEEISDAFDKIVSKADDLIVLADGQPTLRHEAKELLGRLAKNWAAIAGR
jgi:hypothetical protein